MKARILLTLLIACLMATPGIAQTCTTVISNGANLTTAVTGVASGATVCLNAGSYSFSGSVSKSAMSYIQPAPGVSKSQVTITSANVQRSSNLTFQNLTVGGATIGTTGANDSSPSKIYFVNNTFTGPLCIYTSSTMVNADIVIDGNSFANVGQSCTEGRIGVNGLNTSHSGNNGVVIKNNIIGPGGASDGIQINGSARGTQILNNEFTGIKQSSCGTVHCDPIQFYGATNTVIDGNYFHGNSTGIMTPDGNGTQLVVTNNVFVTDGEYPDQIVIGGGAGDVISHNTFAQGARVRIGKINTSSFSSNETVTDNVISGALWLSEGQTTSGLKVDYNLSADSVTRGAHGVNGSATYIGGSNPSGYDNYELSSSSLGNNAASDGNDMGVVFATTIAKPAPPTGVTATVQ